MSAWKVILATMFIFGTGVITGGLLVRNASPGVARQSTAPARQLPVATPGIVRVEFLRRLQRELDLSAEQKLKVDRIITQSQERSRRLLEPVAPQLREEVNRAKAEFRAVLTPDQEKRFEELVQQAQPSKTPREPRRPKAK